MRKNICSAIAVQVLNMRMLTAFREMHAVRYRAYNSAFAYVWFHVEGRTWLMLRAALERLQEQEKT